MPFTEAVLYQTVHYKTPRKSRTKTFEMARLEKGGCDAGNSIEWVNEMIQVSCYLYSYSKYYIRVSAAITVGTEHHYCKCCTFNEKLLGAFSKNTPVL